MIKGIIFDFFGVICPDIHGFIYAAHKLDHLKDFYISISNKLDLGAISEDGFMAALSEKTGIPADQLKQEAASQIGIDMRLIEFIKKLKDRAKIGLISNAQSPFLRGLLYQYQIGSCFDAITISSEVGYIKPDPRIFEHSLKDLGLKPNQCLFVDDNESNVRGAEKIGLKGLVYKDFNSFRKDLVGVAGIGPATFPM